MKVVTWYEFSDFEYLNGRERFPERKQSVEFGDGYTIEDYYADKAGVQLSQIADNLYMFEDEFGDYRYVEVVE